MIKQVVVVVSIGIKQVQCVLKVNSDSIEKYQDQVQCVLKVKRKTLGLRI